MTTADNAGRAAIDQLQHDLHEHFPALAALGSTPALVQSKLYARVRPEVERILSTIAQEDFAPPAPEPQAHIRAVAWNIERGAMFEGLARELRENPALRDADVLLLTELDYGMARSENRCVPRELAQVLGLNYVFVTSYINLAKGNGWDVRVAGENTHALHGNAILSRWPLRNAQLVRLPNGKDKMRGTEKRLGSQGVVIADVIHPHGAFRAASVHLDAHSTQKFRHAQMRLVLDKIERASPALPVLIGGDWNTSTYDSSKAWRSIAGFGRRCAIGVSHMLKHHYLDPGAWFERGLFRELERRGYEYRTLNEPLAGTLHYDMRDIAANTNMRDWVPNWCFWFINRALEPHNGICSLKLDWFAGRGIRPAAPPAVVGNLRTDAGQPLSDHDAIVLDFTPVK
jgi:endonuclease/exonuclease/phosphatase family metal-dependent hydrolase